MLVYQQALSGYGSAAVSYGTWSTTDKDSDVTLSGGNLIATVVAPGVGGVRATTSHSNTGNWYFEVVPTTTGTFDILVGIANAAAALSYPGASTGSYGYYPVDGNKYNNATGAAYGATFTSGTNIGIQLNAGTLIFWKNGVSQGNAYTGLSDTYYPMWGTATTAAGTRACTLNVGASAFAYSLPAGASAWG